MFNLKLSSFFHKRSYFTTYFLCSFFATVSLILFCIFIGWILNQSIKKRALIRVQEEANRIEREIVNIFQDTEKLMVYVGKEIVKSKPDDLLIIWKQLRETLSETDRYKSFMWPDFGWINANHQQVYNTKVGLMDVPMDMSSRLYVKLGFENPWILQFSTPSQSIPVDTNGAFIIPIGIGVTDDKGNFLGIVSSAFHIPDLTRKIDQIIKDRAIDFALIDQKETIILQTFGKVIKEEFVKIPTSLIYEIKILGTPYTLITYLDEVALSNEYYQHFIPHLIKILGGGVCCLFLIYIFLKNILKKNKLLEDAKKQLEHAFNLAQDSDQAKEEFLNRIKKELMVPFASIVSHADVLLKHSKKEINLDLTIEKKIQFLEKMKEATIHLETLTTNVLDLSYVDVEGIIKDCLKIHAKYTFMRGIFLHSDIPKLPHLYFDELRFKQIILGLLSQVIRFTRKGENVFLSVSKSFEERGKYLNIILKNSGNGMSEVEWENMAHKYSSGFSISRYTDGTDLELSAIEKLIQMHGGKCLFEHEWKSGTKITLSFPYRSKEECEKPKEDFEYERSPSNLWNWNQSK